MNISEVILLIYNFSLTVLLLYSSHGIFMLYYRKKHFNKKPRFVNFEKKMVTVQIPLFNEYYVAEKIIDSVCKLDYPKELLEIQILDDSTDETTEIVKQLVHKKRQEGFDISLIHREDRKGFKAGALKNGLNVSKGEFIAIFDADFVPSKNFLNETLKYFTDENIGVVQTRWEHMNEKFSFLTKIQAVALNAHFFIDQTIRNLDGFFINFNGTAGVLRKKCIIDAGNWQDDTITEDLDLSFRAQLKGWKFVFLKDFSTPAELPAEMNSLKAQQFRWTKGAIETCKKLIGKVWQSDFPLKVKLQATYHLTNNIVFPFVLIVAILNFPILFIKASGNYDLYFKLMAVFAIAFTNTFLYYLFAQKDSGSEFKRKLFLYPLFMAGNMGLSFNNSRAVVEGLFNKKSQFIRTPKFRASKDKTLMKKNKYFIGIRRDPFTIVELFLTIYLFAGFCTSLILHDFAAAPFHFFFFLGFAVITYFSIKKLL